MPGSDPKQRPRDSQAPLQTERQEDNVYQANQVGQITAEMVRPDVSGKNWGGFDHEQLRIAALARAIQSRLPYLHHCNAVYCLQDRPSCRSVEKYPVTYLCLVFVLLYTRSQPQPTSRMVNVYKFRASSQVLLPVAFAASYMF